MKPRKYTIRRPAPPPEVDFGDALDDEQRAVVEADPGYLLAVAGAGSGKTRALTYRVAWLLARGTPPERLLLCTFTNRAAREMLQRVERLATVDVNRLWAGTFHHVANRILRTWGDRLGQAADYAILDRGDAVDLLARVIASQPDLTDGKRFPRPGVLVGMISLAVNTGRSLAELLATDYARFAHHGEAIEQVAALYAERKRALGLRDFDDLLWGWQVALAEHPSVAAELQDRFLHVLVDEYQDVNYLQAGITDGMALGHGSLTVVGDDDQAIYGFRGADSRAMLDFPKRHPGTQIHRIQTNYRSTPQILRLASTSVAKNVQRHGKTLQPVRPAGSPPAMVTVDDVHQQAAFVAQRVLELQAEQGLALREMSVLFRAHAHSLELQVELTHRQIPFRVRAGLRFFEQAHIKDALAHLRWVAKPVDELAAMRVLRLQPGIGATAASRTIAAIADAPPSPLDSLLTDYAPKARGRAAASLKKLAAFFEALGDASGPGAALRVVTEGPYRDYAAAQFANAEERLGDLEQLADYAEQYGASGDFLNDIALMSGLAAESFQGGEDPDDCLTLSSIHQAKGLEWKAVFVLWLADGHFPSALALRDPDGEEEERRLLHVAMTRAEDELHLIQPLFAEKRGLPRVITRPSRFIAELEGERPPLWERWQVEEG